MLTRSGVASARDVGSPPSLDGPGPPEGVATPPDPGVPGDPHLAVLEAAGLLDGLTADQRDLAVRLFRPVTHRFGDELSRAGEPSRGVHVVVAGEVRVLRVADGVEEPVAKLGPGSTFGGDGLLDGRPGPCTYRASGPVEVLRLGRDGALALAGASPAIAEALTADHPAADHPAADRRRAGPAPGAARAGGEADAPRERPVVAPAPAAVGSDAEPAPPDRAGRLRRRHRRFPFVAQADENDCGAACLAMIARHHGRAVSIVAIRDAAATGRQGASLSGIVDGGAAVGLEVTPYRISPEHRDELELPAIVHWNDRHWVVLVALGRDHAVVADPASGVRRVDRAELTQAWSGYTAVVRPTAALQDAPVATASLRWMLPILRARRRALVIGLVLALVAAGGEVGIPIVTQRLVDGATGGTGVHGAGALLAALLAVAVAGRFLQRRLLVRAAMDIDGSMIDLVTARLLALPLAYFESRRVGDIERRMIGMAELRRVVVQQGIEVVTSGVLLVAALATMFVYSWVLALAFCLVLPAYALVMRWSKVSLRPIFGAMEEAFGAHLSIQVDLVKGIETVKSLGAEPGQRHRMQAAFDRLRRRIEPGYRAMAGYDVVVWAIGLVAYGAVVYVGGLATASGALTVGAYVAFLALVLLCLPPLTALLQAWDDVQLSSALLTRIHDVISRDPEQARSDPGPGPRAVGRGAAPAVAAATGAGSTVARHAGPVEGRLVACGVGFAVPGGEPVLADVDLEVEPGWTVALVGRSGSGKTTLLRLLAGLQAPSAGRIEWDGVDLRDVDPSAWRAGIGVALQAPYVFDCSIEENVRFGRTDLGAAVVARAIEVAGLADLVAGLPLGLRTPVGEGGLHLSGGEAQRVALARAVYGDPAVLLLDEATSSLDVDTEQAVTERLRRARAGRTMIVATHRLQTVRDADLILTLDHGRIVERGTHQELLARDGLYAHLVRRAGERRATR